MSPATAAILVLLLGSSTYLAGRLHGRLGYRFGYRFGYRQGYFDGDRASWNRRRREAQTAIGSTLAGRHSRVVNTMTETFTLVQSGAKYTSDARYNDGSAALPYTDATYSGTRYVGTRYVGDGYHTGRSSGTTYTSASAADGHPHAD
jgi:hypothetical protein